MDIFVLRSVDSRAPDLDFESPGIQGRSPEADVAVGGQDDAEEVFRVVADPVGMLAVVDTAGAGGASTLSRVGVQPGNQEAFASLHSDERSCKALRVGPDMAGVVISGDIEEAVQNAFGTGCPSSADQHPLRRQNRR